MGTRTWRFFCESNVFRLHANFYDAAGAVQSPSGKSPGNCYTIARGPVLCRLDYVTRLEFCLYVKLFGPSFFKSVDFAAVCFASYLILSLELIALLSSWMFPLVGCSRILNLSSKKSQTHGTSIFLYENVARICAEKWLLGLLWGSKQSCWRCRSWMLCKRTKMCRISRKYVEI